MPLGRGVGVRVFSAARHACVARVGKRFTGKEHVQVRFCPLAWLAALPPLIVRFPLGRYVIGQLSRSM
eukprot:7336676-Pyramimonas_sp.AAC.1